MIKWIRTDRLSTKRSLSRALVVERVVPNPDHQFDHHLMVKPLWGGDSRALVAEQVDQNLDHQFDHHLMVKGGRERLREGGREGERERGREGERGRRRQREGEWSNSRALVAQQVVPNPPPHRVRAPPDCAPCLHRCLCLCSGRVDGQMMVK